MSPADREGLKDEYFFTASEYYVSGRFAFWTKSMGICGNLFHHAIELFLKGHLLLTTPSKALKDDFRHNLPRIGSASSRQWAIHASRRSTAPSMRFTRSRRCGIQYRFLCNVAPTENINDVERRYHEEYVRGQRRTRQFRAGKT